MWSQCDGWNRRQTQHRISSDSPLHCKPHKSQQLLRSSDRIPPHFLTEITVCYLCEWERERKRGEKECSCYSHFLPVSCGLKKGDRIILCCTFYCKIVRNYALRGYTLPLTPPPLLPCFSFKGPFHSFCFCHQLLETLTIGVGFSAKKCPLDFLETYYFFRLFFL